MMWVHSSLTQNLVFVRYGDDDQGDYFLPARVLTPLEGEIQEEQMVIQPFVTSVGKLDFEQVQMIMLGDFTEVPCTLLPSRDVVWKSNVSIQDVTVSYSLNERDNAMFRCEGLYCGEGNMKSLSHEASKVQKQFANGHLIDFEIFLGEENDMDLFGFESPEAIAFSQLVTQ